MLYPPGTLQFSQCSLVFCLSSNVQRDGPENFSEGDFYLMQSACQHHREDGSPHTSAWTVLSVARRDWYLRLSHIEGPDMQPVKLWCSDGRNSPSRRNGGQEDSLVAMIWQGERGMGEKEIGEGSKNAKWYPEQRVQEEIGGRLLYKTFWSVETHGKPIPSQENLVFLLTHQLITQNHSTNPNYDSKMSEE